jgi:hypothetical protein
MPTVFAMFRMWATPHRSPVNSAYSGSLIRTADRLSKAHRNQQVTINDGLPGDD